MHKNCCKTRYNIKHICQASSSNDAKASFKSDECEEKLKSQEEDAQLFGNIFQTTIIGILFGVMGYLVRDLFKNCIFKYQLPPCYLSKQLDMMSTFKATLELCPNYHFNIIVIYLIIIQISTAFLLYFDKLQASKHKYRVWPMTHSLFHFAGGIPTAWLLMNFLRFKICVPRHFYTALALTLFNILWPLLYVLYYLK